MYDFSYSFGIGIISQGFPGQTIVQVAELSLYRVKCHIYLLVKLAELCTIPHTYKTWQLVLESYIYIA